MLLNLLKIGSITFRNGADARKCAIANIGAPRVTQMLFRRGRAAISREATRATHRTRRQFAIQFHVDRGDVRQRGFIEEVMCIRTKMPVSHWHQYFGPGDLISFEPPGKATHVTPGLTIPAGLAIESLYLSKFVIFVLFRKLGVNYS